ncbi:MAG: preprotein translocase subunit SecY [Firmicutes bacterium]|nr:preprotein translocase subunit SecY [[Eubacterium] siraeum]MCM1487557.1 preprotein translocase subunit SecY [Bacillota bacterium]
MFEVFRNAWKLPDLRKKILYTLFIIVIFRLGSAIFVPFLDSTAIASVLGMNSSDGNLFSYWDAMTGGSLSNGTLFAMSITPYINASIIVQLLAVAIKPLERLTKEGDEGRRKLNRINKFVALGLALFQAVAFYITLRNGGVVKYTDGFSGVLAAITIVACFVSGASLIVWLGDQISDKGIGNGISMILFAGIVSRIPNDIYSLVMTIGTDLKSSILVPIILIIYVGMITLVVLMTNAERRIPIQYAKRVVGRKMYGGQSTYLPIKVAMTGVMPIIFAMSIMSLPSTICYFFGIKGDYTSGHDFWEGFVRLFSTSSVLYAILYFLLIIGFNYFYVAITYNPIQIANDLKKNNGAIPGYRPGQPTADFINNSLSKVTLIGALFLGFVAIFPIIFQNISGIQGLSLGGTTVLIVVGVALETVRSLESQMMMRHHKGFLE